jgi:hypothetical protein
MRKSRLAWTQRKTREAHIGAKAWLPALARARPGRGHRQTQF